MGVPEVSLVGLALIILASSISAAKIDAPCSACMAIAWTLQERLENEPTKNHLDMRHRLDSTGQRYGKMINYKVSELRVIELLDGLCEGMNKWTLVTINSSTSGKKTIHWERVSEAEHSSRPMLQEEEVRQKQLTGYCGRTLEDYDDEITEALQKGEMEKEGVSTWLCTNLLKSCPAGGSGKETADGSTSASIAAEKAVRDAAEASMAEKAAAAAAAAVPAGSEAAPPVTDEL